MEIIYSKIQPRMILHVIVRLSDIESERVDIIEPYHLLQMAIMKLPKGKTFRPHKHIPKKSVTHSAPQESWIVLKGQVKAILYDIDDKIIAEPILNAGDASITLGGGHNYEIMKKDSKIIEVKSGPYEGIEKDKIMIE